MGRKGTEDGKRQGYPKEKKEKGKTEDAGPDLTKLIHLKFRCAEMCQNSQNQMNDSTAYDIHKC